MTYRSPFFSARVVIFEVSNPAFGSVIASVWNLSSPVAIFGRYYFFCSSVPCFTSECELK